MRTGIEILTEIGRHERDGLLPNFFSADGTPEAYNTVDSSLWYFWTVQQLGTRCGIMSPDKALIRERFWPVMKRIIRSLMDGTRFGIGMDALGLLQAGDGQTALTWMDATVGGIPVTPRHGYPVEINALWYNALCFARDLTAEFGDPPFFDGDFIPLLRRSFRETFWGHDARIVVPKGASATFSATASWILPSGRTRSSPSPSPSHPSTPRNRPPLSGPFASSSSSPAASEPSRPPIRPTGAATGEPRRTRRRLPPGDRMALALGRIRRSRPPRRR